MISNTNKENANFSSSAIIKSTAIRVPTLLTSPDLDRLNDLVNTAYMSMGHPWPAIGLLEGERYIHPRVEFRTQLVDEIGPDSFVVICRDESVCMKVSLCSSTAKHPRVRLRSRSRDTPTASKT